jgi:chitinase
MDMDELHKRWFSGDIREWFQEQRNIDLEFKGVDHQASVREQVLEACEG